MFIRRGQRIHGWVVGRYGEPCALLRDRLAHRARRRVQVLEGLGLAVKQQLEHKAVDHPHERRARVGVGEDDGADAVLQRRRIWLL